MPGRTYAARWLMCGALWLAAASSEAQAVDASARAFEAYGRGQKLFRERDYEGAQVAFAEAYGAVPNPVVLLGIAEAQERRGLWNEALATLTRYLTERPDAPDRAKVEQEIETVRAALSPVVEEVKRTEAPVPTTWPVSVVHESKMSSSFKLVKAVYAIDGVPVLTRTDDSGKLSQAQRVELESFALTPGTHTLTVSLEYRGANFGVFSYLDSYRYNLRSSHTFTAQSGKALRLTVLAYERGGPMTSLGERPAVRYTETVTPASAAGAQMEAGSTHL